MRISCEMDLKAYLNLLLLPKLWSLLGKEVKFVQHVCSSWAHVCSSSSLFFLGVYRFSDNLFQDFSINWTHFLVFSVSSSKSPLLVRGWMLPSSHVYQGTFSFSRPDKSIHSYPFLVNPHYSQEAIWCTGKGPAFLKSVYEVTKNVFQREEKVPLMKDVIKLYIDHCKDWEQYI